MPDSPGRRKPNRAPTGQPVLDRLLDDLRDADVALEERVVDRRPLHTGHYMVFETDRIVRGDGSVSVRDIVVHPGAVVVAPLDPDGKLLFVTQFRVPCGGAMLELPAGTLARSRIRFWLPTANSRRRPDIAPERWSGSAASGALPDSRRST
jgi:ADP-ribose pyrophosphatase